MFDRVIDGHLGAVLGKAMSENNQVNVLPLSHFEAAAADLEQKLKADLLTEQQTDEITTPLYHYTNVAGLRGILASQSFWFTDYRHLNDPTELFHGVDTAISMVRALPWPREAQTSQFLDLLVDLLRRENFDADYLAFFTCSFSASRDDLGQWRAYGDNGRGVAIGLSPKLFALEERTDYAPDETVFVGPVRYQPEDIRERYARSLRHALDTITAVADTAWFRGLTQPARFLFYREIANELAAVSWIWNSLTSKHEAYEHEREVRLVMLGAYEKLGPYIKSRVRHSEIVPYVPHCMPLAENGSLVEIVVGPAAHKDAERAVAQVIREFNVEGSIKIIRSSIPYRVSE